MQGSVQHTNFLAHPSIAEGRRKFIFLCFLSILSLSAFSQNSFPVGRMEVIMEIVSDSLANEDDTIVSASASLTGNMILELQDTTGIFKIHVKMGSSDGSSDLFSYAYNYDVPELFPNIFLIYVKIRSYIWE